MQALQQLNQPSDVAEFDELRDYPRSLYNDITTKKVKTEDIEVVRGYFELEDEDKKLLPPEYRECVYVRYKMLNNQCYHTLENAPKEITYGDIKMILIDYALIFLNNLVVTMYLQQKKTLHKRCRKVSANGLISTL